MRIFTFFFHLYPRMLKQCDEWTAITTDNKNIGIQFRCWAHNFCTFFSFMHSFQVYWAQNTTRAICRHGLICTAERIECIIAIAIAFFLVIKTQLQAEKSELIFLLCRFTITFSILNSKWIVGYPFDICYDIAIKLLGLGVQFPMNCFGMVGFSFSWCYELLVQLLRSAHLCICTSFLIDNK